MSNMPQRFWNKVDTSDGPDSCWMWTANTRSGYGRFRINGRLVSAHRLAYELMTGQPIGELQIDHTCFNRGCCNPKHLRVVTPKENKENSRGAYRNNITGVRGVTRHGKWSTWQARIRHRGELIHLGYFKTIEEAEAVVHAKRLELFTHNDLDRRVMAP